MTEPQTTGWQPIETAPQDGQWLLVVGPSHTVPNIARPCGPRSDRWEDFWRAHILKAKDLTHWMPLPGLPWEAASMTDKIPDDLLMSIRGGYPEKCNFCEQPYGEDRYPVPEEAGAWACSECEARWSKANAG